MQSLTLGGIAAHMRDKGGGSQGQVCQDGWLTDNSFGLDKINEFMKIVYLAGNISRLQPDPRS